MSNTYQNHPPNAIGGGGADEEYPSLVSHRTKLFHQLARRRDWEIPDDGWAATPQEMLDLVKGEHQPRTKISAARVLVAMSQVNAQGGSIDARINHQLSVNIESMPPQAPADANLEASGAFFEVVSPDAQKQTLQLMHEMGLAGRYLEQLKTESPVPPQNGHHNGNGKNGRT